MMKRGKKFQQKKAQAGGLKGDRTSVVLSWGGVVSDADFKTSQGYHYL